MGFDLLQDDMPVLVGGESAAVSFAQCRVWAMPWKSDRSIWPTRLKAGYPFTSGLQATGALREIPLQAGKVNT
jgi:hypothetical protein